MPPPPIVRHPNVGPAHTRITKVPAIPRRTSAQALAVRYAGVETKR